MKTSTYLFLALIIFSFACSENNNKPPEVQGFVPDTIKTTGIISAIENYTTFQYGTHYIVNDSIGYAIFSDAYSLDDFENQEFTIKGITVFGYPLSGGPDYLEVIEIDE